MNIKFTGTFDDLKEKLKSLSGEWDENQPNKKILRVKGGVLNWFESTGTLSIQGRSPGKEQLESSVPHLIYPDEFPQQAAYALNDQIATKGSTTATIENAIGIEHLYLTSGLKESEHPRPRPQRPAQTVRSGMAGRDSGALGDSANQVFGRRW